MASQVESIKWLPGTSFMVDGFAFANACCRHYFLTHFHSDHTTGLRRGFDAGTVYASPVTAALLLHDFRLRPDVLRVLEVGVKVVIEGVGVTPIDANHCPGAVMFLFEVPTAGGGTEVILHTGDCRWQDWIKERSVLSSMQVDTLFLDTTYGLPRHDFPPQQAAINAMVQAIREAQAQEPATLVVVSSYHIGKERAYFGAARQLGCKVWCSKAKRKVLSLLDLPQADLDLLTDEPTEAGVHVAVSMGMRHEHLAQYIAPGSPWKQVVGVRPTGWTWRKSGSPQVWREGASVIIGVPYSEHSSWSDLRSCVAALRPKRIVPTVNARDAAASRTIVDRFADLMDLSRDRSRLDVWLSLAKRRPALLAPLGPPPLAPGEAPACAPQHPGSKQTDSLAELVSTVSSLHKDSLPQPTLQAGSCKATQLGQHASELPECAEEVPVSTHSGPAFATRGSPASDCTCEEAWVPLVAPHAAHGTGNTQQCTAQQQLLLQDAAAGQGAACSGSFDAAGASCSIQTAAPAAGVCAPQSTQQAADAAPTVHAAAAEADVDLGAVDLDEQAAIWTQLKRHKRARECIAAQQEAARKARRLERCSSSSSSHGSSQTHVAGSPGAGSAVAGVAGSHGRVQRGQSSIRAFLGFFTGRQ